MILRKSASAGFPLISPILPKVLSSKLPWNSLSTNHSARMVKPRCSKNWLMYFPAGTASSIPVWGPEYVTKTSAFYPELSVRWV